MLYGQFDVGALTKNSEYQGQNRKMYDMVVKEARSLAIKAILLLSEEGDRVGLIFENNRVLGPGAHKRA